MAIYDREGERDIAWQQEQLAICTDYWEGHTHMYAVSCPAVKSIWIVVSMAAAIGIATSLVR